MNLQQLRSRVGVCELREALVTPALKSEDIYRKMRELKARKAKTMAAPPDDLPGPKNMSYREPDDISAQHDNMIKAKHKRQQEEKQKGSVAKYYADFHKNWNEAAAKRRDKLGSIAMGLGTSVIAVPTLAVGGDMDESDAPQFMYFRLREEDEVEMPKKEYKKEHQHLLKVLKRCKTAGAKQEARKQSKEMHKELRKKEKD